MTKRKKINYNKEESKINKEYSKCVGKVGKSVWQKYTYKRPPTLKNLPVKDRWKAINASRKAFKKTHKKEMKEYDKRWTKTYKKCNKHRRKKKNTLLKHKPKEKSIKCCKCHYVKNKRGLRKVRGAYGHCSYDMQNCCKDKKSISKK
jgi:hypothetical protein